MNVTRADQDGQTTLITVTVEPKDYTEQLEKKMKEYRRKANIPGFRVGMVPMGIVNKMYRKGALADLTYHTATDAAFDFIKEQAIEPIGDLMPAETQKEIDFSTEGDFDFVFEIGLAPQVKLDLTDKDKIERIVVEPSADMISGYTDNFLRRFGKLVDVDKVEKEEAVSCNLDNTDMKIEDAYVGLISMSEDERKPFIGKTVGDKMKVNINELYKDEKQRAAILSVKEGELAGINPEFELEITKIRAFQNPTIDADFLKLAFPDGDVTTEKQFEDKMKERVASELSSQTEFKWEDNVRDYVVKKADLSLPAEFLKRWLFNINDGKFTMEDIEKEFSSFEDMMKWDLVKRHVAKGDKLEVTADDATAEAKQMALAQFRYYGMAEVADDMLDNYAKQILSNKDEAKKIFERVGDKKIVSAIASKVSVKEKKMSVDEFSSMMQAK